MCQLVSMSMDGRILEGIERLTLADSRLTVQHLDRLMTLLKSHQEQMLNRVDEGLKVHYIVSRNSIEDLRSGRLTIDDIVDYQTPFASVSGSAEQSGDSGLRGPPQFNWEAEIAACNRLFRQAITAATQLTYYPDSFGDFREEPERCRSEIDRFTELVTSTPVSERARLRDRAPSFLHGLWVAPVEPLVEAQFRSAAQLAGTQALLIVRRYELVHGRIPDSLEEAAAESVLETVPIDPFSGRPIRMTVIAGKPTVYSVGKDGDDDGGQLDWNFGRQPGDYLFTLPPIVTGND